MGLHNFIKIYSSHEKDIYNAPIDISDNTEADKEGKTQQSDFTQMNTMRDRMVDQMWKNYQVYLV